ncbi:MAG: HEAT repeat domain-containing protein [Actinomycetota bacterium]
MIGLLQTSSLVLAVASILALAFLVARRTVLIRAERSSLETQRRLRPIALDLAEGDSVDLAGLDRRELRALASLLHRFSGLVAGPARDNIAAFFGSSGLAEEESRALRSRRAWRRALSARLLGVVGSRSTIADLVAALDDRDGDVRSAAATSLGRLDARSSIGPIIEAAVDGRIPESIAGDALLQIGPDAVPRLVALLSHRRAPVRAASVRLVGLLGSAGDSDAVAEAAMRDPSPEVRARAAVALGRIGSHRHTEALIRLLSDRRTESMRAAAASALGAIGDPQAIDALFEAAVADSYEAASAAARAIGTIDPDAAVALAERDDAGHIKAVADLIAIFGSVRA